MRPIELLFDWKSDAETRLAALDRGTYWCNGRKINDEIRTRELAFIAELDDLIFAERPR
jgi:hypothetical protein